MNMWLIFLLFLASSFCLRAELLFVTPAGAGATTGSDWSNAFAGMGDLVWGGGAGQLGAGDTLYIAGGTYTNANNLELLGNGTLGNLIRIKRARATNSECADAVGWSGAFDDQVVISVGGWGIWSQETSPTSPSGRYLEMDGIITDGIRLNLVQNSQATGIRLRSQGAFNSSFRNIGIYGPSTNATAGLSYAWTNDVRGIFISGYSIGNWTNGVSVYPSDITFDNCTIAGVVSSIYATGTQRLTFQSNNIHTIEGNSGGFHANIGYFSRCMDLTFRHNEVHNSSGITGLFFTYSGDDGVNSSNIFIHGNIFRDGRGTDSTIKVRQDSTNQGPFYIYNNTFVNMYYGVLIQGPLNPLGQSFIRNNFFVGMGSSAIAIEAGFDTYVTTNHNHFTTSTGSTNFIDWGATNVLGGVEGWKWVRNLRLASGATPINLGTNLGSIYALDKDSQTFGADGTWDLGAYEFAQTLGGHTNTARLGGGKAVGAGGGRR